VYYFLTIILLLYQTLCALIKAGFSRTNFDVSCDVIELLIGGEAAEIQMQLLIEHCSDILTSNLFIFNNFI